MTTEYQYLGLIGQVLSSDNLRMDRTGTGTRSVFGRQIRFDLSRGFPLPTTKKVPLRLVIEELLWMLAGDSNAHTLRDKNVNIWNEWALENGDLGPVYGAQWRHWKGCRTVRTTRPRGLGELLEEAIKARDSKLAADLFGLLTVQKGEHATATQMHELYPQLNLIERLSENQIATTVTEDKLEQYEIDQMAELMYNLKHRPFSRRHMISAWNVADLPNENVGPHANAANGRMALAACHAFFQFYVEYRPFSDVVAEASEELQREFAAFAKELPEPQGPKGGKGVIGLNEQLYKFFDDRGIKTKRLSCQLYQRSADTMLGVPFNIASYALLTMMVAQCADMVVGDFVHTFGDLHIYTNHFEGAEEQLKREPRPQPTVRLNPAVKDLFGFKIEDFELNSYDPHPKIDFGISV